MSADTDPAVGLTGARFGEADRYAVPPQVTLPAAQAAPAESADAEVHPAEVHPAEVHPAEVHPAEVHPAEVHPADPRPAPIGARFARPRNGKPRERHPSRSGSTPAPQEPPLSKHQRPEPTGPPNRGWPGPSDPGPDPDLDLDLDAASAPTVRVRPYVHTGGRTSTRYPLPIEALVCAAPGASELRVHGTHRSVLELCRVPQSVAEVSARLGVPLAVTRVLVEDLMTGQLVTVQRGVDHGAPDMRLMERVLAGLRRL